MVKRLHHILIVDHLRSTVIEMTTTKLKHIKGYLHIKAPKLLLDSGKEVKAGYIISYVKTKTGGGVRPVNFLVRTDDIDTEKYLIQWKQL